MTVLWEREVGDGVAVRCERCPCGEPSCDTVVLMTVAHDGLCLAFAITDADAPVTDPDRLEMEEESVRAVEHLTAVFGAPRAQLGPATFVLQTECLQDVPGWLMGRSTEEVLEVRRWCVPQGPMGVFRAMVCVRECALRSVEWRVSSGGGRWRP